MKKLETKSRPWCAALLFLAAASLMLWNTTEAQAQSRAGLRAGISVDPDQVYFGGHIDVAEVAQRLWFRPNVEVGLGDSVTLAAFNAEFVYRFAPLRSRNWAPYAGGGPALVITTHRNRAANDTNAGPGFNFVAGLEQTRGLMAELKVGVLDSPGFKLGIGWTW